MPASLPPLYSLIVRHERHLQGLCHGHQTLSRQWLQEHGASDPDFADWLTVRLRLPSNPERMQQLPISLYQSWAGWQSYYQGHYQQAHEQFMQAWKQLACDADNPALVTDVALGFGKVYTRTGHWKAARDWILYSLTSARSQPHLFSVTEGYGALGELLLRAGHTQAAQACMGSAHLILPPGSGQQAKQLNYLASTLMRNGALLHAESLLMTSLHMARDQGDSDSVWHALARLQFLQLQYPDLGSASDIATQMQAYLPTVRTPVACGFLLIGRAILLQRQGMDAAAVQCLEQAQADFGDRLPLEQEWAHRLLCAHQGASYTPHANVSALQAMVPMAAPVVTCVLDKTWSMLPMQETNGFAGLLGPLGSVQEEALAWRSFFI